jgi:hypothetical protein
MKGDLLLHGHSRFYYKNEVHKLPDQPTNAVTFWDAQGTFTVFYGLGKTYEIGLSQILYQDNHKGGSGYNLPDDLYLKFKFASLGPKILPIKFGAQINSRIPTAKYHNIPLEPYSAGNLEFSILGLISYSPNLLSSEESFNAHVNVGYLDHNDIGENLVDESEGNYKKSTSSKEFIYGVGIVYPITKFDFSFEFYGNRHLSRPPAVAYSRYNYAYITPGITYHPYYWLSVAFGFDYRLTAAKPNESAYTITKNMPVFPTWRMNFGVKINLISKIQNRFEEKDETKLSTEKDKGVYEQIADERKQVEDAERELEKIREERKRMDEMLKRLRKVLEFKEKEEEKKEPEKK